MECEATTPTPTPPATSPACLSAAMNGSSEYRGSELAGEARHPPDSSHMPGCSRKAGDRVVSHSSDAPRATGYTQIDEPSLAEAVDPAAKRGAAFVARPV